MRRVDRWEDTKDVANALKEKLKWAIPFCSWSIWHFIATQPFHPLFWKLKRSPKSQSNYTKKLINTSNDTNWFEALDLQWCMWIESFWTISISTKCKLECKGTSYCLFASAPFSSSATIHGCLGPWTNQTHAKFNSD